MAAPGTGMAGCTTVSGNYGAYARVLAASWRRHHPQAPFVVLLLDGDGDGDGDVLGAGTGGPGRGDEGVVVLTPFDLGLDEREVRLRLGMYGPLELATSLKPHLLRALLDRGHPAAVFVDPDTDIYAPLTSVGAAAARHGVALTPHVLHPVPLDGLSPSELDLAATGVFNTGLVAVGDAGRPFLDWWGERLARQCVIDAPAGLFVDQRVVDWVPSYFDSVVLRDPAVNVAFWNLHERTLRRAGGGFTVDGEPLRHFHFSGFEPRNPGLLTTYDLLYETPLRVRLDDHPALRELCAGYARRVLAAGHEELSARGYALALDAAGEPVTAWQRAVLREAVVDAERRGAAPPPSPHDPAQVAAFRRLVGDPGTADLSAAARARIARVDDAPRRPPASPLARTAFRMRRSAGRALRQVATTAPGGSRG